MPLEAPVMKTFMRVAQVLPVTGSRCGRGAMRAGDDSRR
jgi:hypothetical protein